MTTSRIDFAALGRAQRVEPVVLIAGAPVVFTVGGTRPTTTAVSSGTVDPMWWPGTGTLTQTFPDGSTWDPVRDLLDPRTVWTLRSALELLKGDITVEPLPIDLLDRNAAATALLSRRSAATGQLLAAELSATGTTATLATTTGFASGGGIAHMGREAIGYAGKTSTTLTGLTRGLFGSTALAHRTGSRRGMSDPLVVNGALPRYLQGRRAMVFLCRVDGTTLYDPTLIFSGIVGAGITMVDGGARWQVTLDPTTELLSRAPSLPVELYGWHHLNSERGYLSPLTGILGGLGPTLNNGWSPNFAEVARVWNRTSSGIRPATGLSLSEASGRLLVHNNGSVNDPAPITSFLDPQELSIASGATAHFATAPDTCLVLEGYLKLRADDFGRIPSTLSIAVTDPAPGSANVALIADTDETEHFAAFIATRDPLTNTIQLAARSTATARERVRASRITRRTTAQVGLIATGPHCVGALRALAAALVEMGGGDDFAGTIDWDRIAAVFRSVPSVGLPEGREYEVGVGDDSLLSLLVDEARLRGCTLTVRHGRLSVVRAASFASSEAVGVVEIIAGDLLVDGTPARRIPFEVVDQPEPSASTIAFATREGVIRYTDDTYAAEFGSAKVVECKALRWLPTSPGSAPPREIQPPALGAVAQQILGVLGEPQRIVRVTLGPRFLGLEPGDLVLLTHDEVPAWDGTRGVTGAVCQVDEVQRSIFGGQARAQVSLRIGETGIGGYAPAALVAAGGLSGMSTTVSLDTSTAFGASCFAPPGESPVYGFAAGDVVVLSQYDAAAITVTEITRTIVSVDPVAHTIVLDVAPSAGMVAQAASAYGVVLRTAPWTSATAAPVGDVPAQQARFAFAADAATGAFSDGSDPKRWAA